MPTHDVMRGDYFEYASDYISIGSLKVGCGPFSSRIGPLSPPRRRATT